VPRASDAHTVAINVHYLIRLMNTTTGPAGETSGCQLRKYKFDLSFIPG
jgi:hypothetical protein